MSTIVVSETKNGGVANAIQINGKSTDTKSDTSSLTGSPSKNGFHTLYHNNGDNAEDL